MVVAQEGRLRDEAAIWEERKGLSPHAEKEEKSETRSYFMMPDGTLVFDPVLLAETIASYAHYAR